MISLASSLPRIQVNDTIPDNVITGMNARGRVIVCIQFSQPYHFLWGTAADQDDVAEWHVCAAHARRLAIIAGWRMAEYACRGNA